MARNERLRRYTKAHQWSEMLTMMRNNKANPKPCDKDNGAFYKSYKTKIIERNFRAAGISADAPFYLSASAEVAGTSGKFFNLTTMENPAPPALDREVAEELCEVSLKLSGLDAHSDPPSREPDAAGS